MNKKDNKIEIKENYLVTNALNTIKYVLGNDLSSRLNTALQDYIDDITRLSIDYSDIKDDLIRSQLENFNQMMIMAKARNDFAEFCRCAGLKIESVLEHFIENHKPKTEDKSYENYQSRYYGKYKKYDYWYDYFNVNEHQSKFYYIYNLLKIRDAASHKNLYTDTMSENIREIHCRNSDYSIEQMIKFYKSKNFTLVKDRTEWFVKKTLLHLESL